MTIDLFAFARAWQTMSDPMLQTHGETTRTWSMKIAECIGGLSAQDRSNLALAAEFHDIGKAFIPQAILQKTGMLGDAENAAMRMHAELGARLFAFPETERVSEIILSHHEWFNGNGYPNHLRGDEIPLVVRVLSVADSIAAMLEARAYHAPAKNTDVIAEMKRWYEIQFDPYIAGIAVKLLE